MKHEPECPWAPMPWADDPDNCICEKLRAAYRRGREDERAEKQPVVLSFRRPITNKQYRRIVAAFAAARGDGEKA